MTKILRSETNGRSDGISHPVNHDIVQEFIKSELLGQTAIRPVCVLRVGPK